MPTKRKNTVNHRTGRRRKTLSEVDELEQKLSEAHEHRDLLIRTLHGFTANIAANRNLLESVSKPDLDAILAWLIDEIGKLTATRPILGASTLTALKVPLPRLTKEVNSKWFPNGGGFPSIAGSTMVGDLAYAIWQHA
jgi:hypothetical protein